MRFSMRGQSRLEYRHDPLRVCDPHRERTPFRDRYPFQIARRSFPPAHLTTHGSVTPSQREALLYSHGSLGLLRHTVAIYSLLTIYRNSLLSAPSLSPVPLPTHWSESQEAAALCLLHQRNCTRFRRRFPLAYPPTVRRIVYRFVLPFYFAS